MGWKRPQFLPVSVIHNTVKIIDWIFFGGLPINLDLVFGADIDQGLSLEKIDYAVMLIVRLVGRLIFLYDTMHYPFLYTIPVI